MKTCTRYPAFLALFGIILFCGTEQSLDGLAGPSTEEGNPVISGIVLDTASQPVENATVIAYRSLSDLEVPIPVAATTTNQSGEFSFYDLQPDEYSLLVIDPDSTMYAYKRSAGFGPADTLNTQDSLPKQDEGGVSIDTCILLRPGVIQGVVTRGGVLGTNSQIAKDDAFIEVILKELGAGYTTGPDGRYAFTAVPQGIYTLIFYADDGFFTTYKYSIPVTSGDTTVVDTVTLERIPWLEPPKPEGLTGEYDMAAGLIRLQWSPVNLTDLRGYKVVRYDASWMEDTTYTTTDTFYVDTVVSLPPGTSLSYIVRSVNMAFMESANEGPVEFVTVGE